MQLDVDTELAELDSLFAIGNPIVARRPLRSAIRRSRVVSSGLVTSARTDVPMPSLEDWVERNDIDDIISIGMPSARHPTPRTECLANAVCEVQTEIVCFRCGLVLVDLHGLVPRNLLHHHGRVRRVSCVHDKRELRPLVTPKKKLI